MSHSISSCPETLADPDPISGILAPTSSANDGRRGTAESERERGGDVFTRAVNMLIAGIPSSSASHGLRDGRRSAGGLEDIGGGRTVKEDEPTVEKLEESLEFVAGGVKVLDEGGGKEARGVGGEFEEGAGSRGGVGPLKGFRKVRRAPLIGLPMVLGRRLRESLSSSLSVSSSIPLPSSSTFNSFR